MTSLIPEHAIRSITTSFVAKATADPSDVRTLVAWRKGLAAAVAGDWNNPDRRPLPPGAEGTRGLRRAGNQDWVTDADARLREAIQAGRHGATLKTKLEQGNLDADTARRLIRDDRDAAQRNREAREDADRRRGQRGTGPVPIGAVIAGLPKTGAA